MDPGTLRRVALEKYSLRLHLAMSQYLSEKALAGDFRVVPVIGGDARTGRPRRVELPLDDLARFSQVYTSELS
jgi:hypothetical protein